MYAYGQIVIPLSWPLSNKLVLTFPSKGFKSDCWFHIPRMLHQEKVEKDLLGLYFLSRFFYIFYFLFLLSLHLFDVEFAIWFSFILVWCAAQRLVVKESISFYITCWVRSWIKATPRHPLMPNLIPFLLLVSKFLLNNKFLIEVHEPIFTWACWTFRCITCFKCSTWSMYTQILLARIYPLDRYQGCVLTSEIVIVI